MKLKEVWTAEDLGREAEECASARRVFIAVNRWLRSGKAPEDLRAAWEEYAKSCRSAGITEEF